MDNTSRVAQWRQKMRDEGKEPRTIWLSQTAVLRLAELESTLRSTASEIIEQALAQFQPGNPPRIDNTTDTTQIQTMIQDTVQAMWPVLKESLIQELRGEMVTTAMNGTATVIEHGNVPEAISVQDDGADPGNSLVAEPTPTASQRFTRKLTQRQIRALRDKRLSGVKVPALMEEYNISRASVFRYLQSDKR
jgi:hypothetical protein